MKAQIIMFMKLPEFDSKRRNGYLATKGVEISVLASSINTDRDVTAFIQPISIRGHASPACRVSIALPALPEVINPTSRIGAILCGPPAGNQRVSRKGRKRGKIPGGGRFFSCPDAVRFDSTSLWSSRPTSMVCRRPS